MNRTGAVAVLATAVLLAAGHGSSRAAGTTAQGVSARQTGVAWVAGPSIDTAALEPLRGHGVRWISQTPLGWMRAVDDPALELITEGAIYWGETDVGLVRTVAMARELGIETMLRPHVWIDRDGRSSDVHMTTDAAWNEWFAAYETFILHYAELAAANEVPVLCIGTELHKTVVARPDRWRQIIAAVRDVYPGALTYAASWDDFADVPFWDELDFIGIQAYFPLSDFPAPAYESLLEAWQPHVEAIAAVQARHDRPVLFTELGYRAWRYAAQRPWERPAGDGHDHGDGDAGFDALAQEHLYRAFFETFWSRDWFAGAYFWKWFPGHEFVGGQGDIGFTPQNKPAADVLADWYSRPTQR